MKLRSLPSLFAGLVLWGSLGAFACGADDEDGAGQTVSEGETLGDTDRAFEPATPTPASAACERGTLEIDFAAAPLAGVAVGAGGLRAGQYVVSSTYLPLKVDARQTASDLLQPVIEELQTRDGLLALSLGESQACRALRTLTVWRDDAAMIAFVTSSAHAAAALRVGDVSRGGSAVTHWLGDEGSATWVAGARELGAVEGPLY